MSYNPYKSLPGGFSPNDGTIDFYLRIRNYLDKKKILLDIGAGKGDWFDSSKKNKITKETQFLKNSVKKFYAADVDPQVLKNKTSHQNYLIKNHKIPLKSNSIDIIISDWTLEHIENPKTFFKEINRLLKKNGLIFFRTPHKYNYFALANSILEGTKFKDILLKKTQPNRAKWFKSYYKINTYNSIQKLFKNYKINYFLFIPDPAYYFGSKILFYLFKFLHLISPKFFVGIIICCLKKK